MEISFTVRLWSPVLDYCHVKQIFKEQAELKKFSYIQLLTEYKFFVCNRN